MLRTDCGGAFCSNKFKNYCEELVRHSKTLHWTILTTVEWSGRTSKQKRCGNGKNLSKRNENACYLVGETVRHSVYVLNMMPI